MPERKFDVIMHPIRLRIVEAIQGRRLTAAQIGRIMPEVPQATLYRHINRLVSAEVLQVVDTRQAHGAVEKTYAMPDGASDIPLDEFDSASMQEHREYLAMMLSSTMGAFSRYADTCPTSPLNDGFRYGEEILAMTDDEYREFRQHIFDMMSKRRANPSATGKRYAIAWVLVPDIDPIDGDMNPRESSRLRDEIVW